MIDPISAKSFSNLAGATVQTQSQATQKPVAADSYLTFEKMLWSEMLSHAGLEDALTQNGGEAASAFSKYVVEAISEDIAARHPLGLGPPETSVPSEKLSEDKE